MTTPTHSDRLAVARVTLEALTPFIVGTGGGDDVRDSICVSDANGLPTLPGTSLAGVLRHAWAGDDDHRAHDLFGFQKRGQGASSRLEVSWAQIHDENDQPVPFRGATSTPFLDFLAGGVLRDHVRLNGRGTVDDQGKFDENLVPAGARFTFELAIDDPKHGELDELLALLASLGLRLGGRSRRGFGAFRIVRVLEAEFDLRKAEDRKAFATLPRRLELPAKALKPRASLPAGKVPTGTRIYKLDLEPEDHWLFGGGVPTDEHQRGERTADIVPVSEQVVVWTNDRGAIGARQKLIPASSVKGALRHRAQFHARRRSKQWLQKGKPSPEPSAIEKLFGSMKDDEGTPGLVFLRDLYLDARTAHLDHVCIDRFTGAPMSGMLFSEAPLFKAKKPVSLEVVIHPGAEDGAVSALRDALDDLCEGRLALGGGANRGHGFFRGTITEVGGAR